MILQVAKELELREIELNKTKEEKKKLAEKLKMLQGKLIVGGVDLVRRSLIIAKKVTFQTLQKSSLQF